MAQLRPKVDELRSLGAELVLVGNGTVEHLQWFLEDQTPNYPVYTDPSLEVYRAAGMRRDAGAFLSLKAVGATLRARRAGFTQPGVKGDPWQQGGVLLILPDGTIAFRQVSEHLGDHASPEAIVEAVRKATAGTPGRG